VLHWSYYANGDRDTEGRPDAGGSLVYNYHPTSKRLESVAIRGSPSPSVRSSVNGRGWMPAPKSRTITSVCSPSESASISTRP